MIANKIIGKILGNKPKKDLRSRNSKKDEICDNCGRDVYERELMFKKGKEFCRYCIND